ncbi:MAG TPA: hypothetical protein PLU30_21995 [Verrucomicrobiae bacterium]|nr:hypothetical protein [Verrucomicrobiae bacterium]
MSTRTVETRPPSFPQVKADRPIVPEAGKHWQVVCGDAGHWRVGLYSPANASAEACAELEQHDCPEFFILLSGRVTLVLVREGKLVQQELEQGRPVLVECPHNGFCPGGPNTGVALVVERDSFETIYRPAAEWLTGAGR